MIYIFRKEMKKWHTVLWVVFASLALGSGISIWRHRGAHELQVGKVNGETVVFAEYRRALNEINMRLDMLRPYAKLYGLSEEALFSSILGMGRPEDAAFDNCVREKLMTRVVEDFNIKIASDVFKEELMKSMPEGVMDEKGYVNMDMYQNYLSRMNLSPRDFEENRYNDLRREVIHRFMGCAFYAPQFAVREAYEKNNGKKCFVYAHLPFKRFLQDAEKAELDEKALKAFYEEHKEVYRTPEKRKVRYWMVSPDDYLDKVVVDDEAVKNFYDRNKSNLYRIAPKLKVRRILCASASGDARKKAEKVLQEAKSSPDAFAELAKKHSDDASAKNGGLLDFFGRGTHDKAFEDAAFKLMTPGELSPVVKTAKGYEIIQLVERKKAEEKPLEAVKDEIVKNLRTKKAVTTLRGDLETMIHEAHDNVAALENFVKHRQFEEKESGWLTAKDATTSDVQGTLAQKLFAPSKRQQTYGYFMVEGKYVIYLLAGTEKSVIPALDQIKSAVIDDYNEHQAGKALSNAVLQVKTDILHKKINLEQAVAKFGINVSKTGLIGSEEDVVGDKKNPLASKMFVLSDASQVMQHSYNKDYYLAQLLESAPIDQKAFEAENEELTKKQRTSGSRAYAGAFIASLQRTAKIDVDKKMLSKTIASRD